PRRLPALDLEIEKLDVRGGGNRALGSGLTLKSGPGPAGDLLRLGGLIEWDLAPRSGIGEVAVSFNYAAGMLSGLEVVLDGQPIVPDGRLDLPRLEGEAQLRIGGGGGKLSLAPGGPGRLAVDLALERARLERVLEPAILDESPALGELSLSLSANFLPGEPLDAEATLALSLREARWGEVPLSELEVEARLGHRSL